MRPGTPGFVGARLTEAREARYLTAVSLAEMLGVSPQLISKYENGHNSPSPDVLDDIAEKLNLPAHFFTRSERSARTSTIFYRSMAAATKKARRRAEAKFDWLRDIALYLGEYVAFPEPNLPDLRVPDDPSILSNDDIEEMAQEARRHWGMAEAPIGNMVALLENQGAIIARQELGAESLDSLSEFIAEDRRPYMILGTDRGTAVRWRFDAAHELGHMLLHAHVDQRRLLNVTEFKRIEDQAHRFAAAFLLPLGPFSDDFFAASLDVFRSIKQKWKVSIAMMIMRAHQAGLISDETQKRLWINYGRKRWARQEPYDDQIPHEEPRLLRSALNLVLSNGAQTPEDLVARLGLSLGDIETLIGLPRGHLGVERAPVQMIQPRLVEKRPEGGDDLPPARVIELPYRPRN